MNLDIALVQETTTANAASMQWLLFAQQITQIVCVGKIQAATDRFLLRLLMLPPFNDALHAGIQSCRRRKPIENKSSEKKHGKIELAIRHAPECVSFERELTSRYVAPCKSRSLVDTEYTQYYTVQFMQRHDTQVTHIWTHSCFGRALYP